MLNRWVQLLDALFMGKMNNPHNLFSCGVLQVGFECAKQIYCDIFRNVYNFIAVYC